MFRFGTDPEFFIKRNNKLISAIPIIPGTKEEPEMMEDGSMSQHDNVTVEFAIPVADGIEDTISKVRSAFTQILKKLPNDVEFSDAVGAIFDEEELDHPEAQRFGCTADYDAWTISQNEPPMGEDGFRSCGGHIHVGYSEGSGNDFLLDMDGRILTVKMMDLFHGIISVFMDKSEGATKRRTLYGKAGCHRPKEYGIEYRVMSNFWTKSPKSVAFIYHLTEDVLRHIRNGKADELLTAYIDSNEIRRVINEGDAEKAQIIYHEYLRSHLSTHTIAHFEEVISLPALSIPLAWGIGATA